ncbi:unnamed protein product [Miscanthus lutarioriparius]|uniref:Uncharacterized protein n=1 Tax=Miscanthus lutarioriparius TaxID=422564 RepID=A0A811QM47_9POAL|nr:unnamed protein product [Miscanthus lutarioriparius]
MKRRASVPFFPPARAILLLGLSLSPPMEQSRASRWKSSAGHLLFMVDVAQSRASRSGAGGEHRVARLRQRRKRTRGQPAQRQDGVQAYVVAAFDFLVTVVAAAADFLPNAASSGLACSDDFLTCPASTFFTCAANFDRGHRKEQDGGHTPNFPSQHGNQQAPNPW